MKKKFNVLGLGCVSVDLIGLTDSWPESGKKKLLQHFETHDGGLVGTALVAVSRLGGKAGFIGKLGFSEMSCRAVKMLKKEGVDTSLLIRCKNTEPIIALVISNSSDNQRNIFFSRNNVEYPFPDEIPDQKWFTKTDVLLIDFEAGIAGIKAAEIARKNHIPVVIDIEQIGQHVTEAIAISDHVIVPEEFALRYAETDNIEKALIKIQTNNNQTVIITLGDKGCKGISSNEIFYLPAYKVNEYRDLLNMTISMEVLERMADDDEEKLNQTILKQLDSGAYNSMIQAAEQTDTHETILRIIGMGVLNQREIEVIKGVYFEDREFSAIGAEMGVSRQRVGQLKQSALDKLRGSTTLKSLYKQLD